MEIFNPESEIHISECRKKVFVFIILLTIILVIYSNTFHASWNFDDTPNILENKALHLTSLTWANIKQTFFDEEYSSGRLYRPVARLSFALNYYLGKDDVFGYHVVNISIHFLTAFFLFLFIYHTLNLPLQKKRYGQSSYFIAVLSTVFWAINPMQTQAVTYIVQRMASMAGLFYIMAMYFYLKGRSASHSLRTNVYFFICAISVLLAFGSKENTFVLPITLLLYELIILQPNPGNILDFINSYNKRVFSFQERLLTEPRIIIFYISLILYPMPTRLSLVHDITLSHSLFNPPTTILGIFFILASILFALLAQKKWPLLAFCILFFFLNHSIETISHQCSSLSLWLL